MVAISLCIRTTSSSISQDQLEHADSTRAAVVVNSNALVKLPELLTEQYPTIRSLALARRGCVKFEYYKVGMNAQSQSPVRSITKRVLSVLVGIALDRGYLRLNQKLSELLPEVSDPTIRPYIRGITIRDLLTMTSGFDSAAPFGAKAGHRPLGTAAIWRTNSPRWRDHREDRRGLPVKPAPDRTHRLPSLPAIPDLGPLRGRVINATSLFHDQHSISK